MDDVVANIAKIAAFPARVETLVAPLTAAQLTFRPHDTEWSMREHIGHLIDIDRIYRERIALIRANEYQPFAPFSIDGIHRQGNYQAQPINTLMASLHTTRHETVRVLRDMTASEFMRIGLDSYFGEITLARLIEILVHHADEHYDQMCRIATQAHT
ncbi:MAG: DinB family protein [Roseiflexaceae bacterium]